MKYAKGGAREWQIVYKLNQVWKNAITEWMLIWLDFLGEGSQFFP